MAISQKKISRKLKEVSTDSLPASNKSKKTPAEEKRALRQTLGHIFWPSESALRDLIFAVSSLIANDVATSTISDINYLRVFRISLTMGLVCFSDATLNNKAGGSIQGGFLLFLVFSF